MSVLSEKVRFALFEKMQNASDATGVYWKVAPEGSEYPFAVFDRVPGALPRSLNNNSQGERDRWFIKALADEDASETLDPSTLCETILSQLESAIGNSLIIEDGSVSQCVRVGDIPSLLTDQSDRQITQHGFQLETFVSSEAETEMQIVKQATIVLDNDQIKAVSTQLEIIPSPGAGYFIQPMSAVLILDASADEYTNVDEDQGFVFKLGEVAISDNITPVSLLETPDINVIGELFKLPGAGLSFPADGKTFVKESDFTPKQWKAVTAMNAVKVVEPKPTEAEKDEIVFEEIK
jgi:hypothetical protein